MAGNITLESIGESASLAKTSDPPETVVQIRMSTARGAISSMEPHSTRVATTPQREHLDQQLTVARSARFFANTVTAAHSAPGGHNKLYHGKTGRSSSFVLGIPATFSNTDARMVLTAPARTGLFTYQGADGQNHMVNLLTTSTRGLPINAFTKSLIDATPLPVAGGSVSVNPTSGDGLNIVGIRFNSPGTELDKLYDLRVDHKIFESSRWGTHWMEGVWHWEHDPSSPRRRQFPQSVATN